jgi:hypothetical protein
MNRARIVPLDRTLIFEVVVEHFTDGLDLLFWRKIFLLMGDD